MKPLLAATCENLEQVTLPVMVSPKLDGVRATVQNGVLVSRTLKPIPNLEVRGVFSRPEFEGLDGELIVGNPTDPDCFKKTSSVVMTIKGSAEDVKFHVFDRVKNEPFCERFDDIMTVCEAFLDHLELVPHEFVTDLTMLEAYEKTYVSAGYEGVMLRDPNGKYKFGRSTLKEQILLKFKRFATDEARIIGFEEKMHNENEKTLDERGYAKRSSHQENLVPAGTLGALVVQDVKNGVEFRIGTGFTDEDRKEIWDNQAKYLGLIVSYQHQPPYVKEKPRFPSFRGFRHEEDM